ncbi:MAG: MlaD family protein [Planctomycetaceae bacterium]|nr:MlaD family protein [Planctomycetaceae bacterium]
MEDRKIKLQLGIVGVTVIAATVFLVTIFGQGRMPSFFSSDYTIYVLLQQAPMLTPNSPVLKNGVEIGRVVDVSLTDDDLNVKISARINGGVRLYETDECWLNMNILGQSSLNFKPRPGVADRGQLLVDGSVVHGNAPPDIIQIATNLEGDLTGALRQFTMATKAVSDTFMKVDQIIGTPEEVIEKQKYFEKIVKQAESTLGSIDRLAHGVEDILNDPNIKNSIHHSAAELPQLIADTKTLMTNVNNTLDEFKKLFGHVEGTFDRVSGTFDRIDNNLDNMTKFTTALGDNGPKMIDGLANAAIELENSVRQVSVFMEALNNPDGSVGQMLKDPEFFQSLNRTVKNAERLTQQLQPILRDINVFSDKIARDPGLLGVKGIFTKSPPVKGIPNAYPGTINVNQTFDDGRSRERIQWLRSNCTRLWPFGRQRFANEIVPQNRFASLVEDLAPFGERFAGQPPMSDAGYDTESLETPYNMTQRASYNELSHDQTQPVFFTSQEMLPVVPVVSQPMTLPVAATPVVTAPMPKRLIVSTQPVPKFQPVQPAASQPAVIQTVASQTAVNPENRTVAVQGGVTPIEVDFEPAASQSLRESAGIVQVSAVIPVQATPATTTNMTPNTATPNRMTSNTNVPSFTPVAPVLRPKPAVNVPSFQPVR